MYLSSSVQNLQNILVMAEDLNADAIHFFAPDAVFILSKNKEDYVYLKTELVIGNSLMMPRSSYRNLLLYIKSTKRGFYLIDSPFHQKIVTSITVKPHALIFNAMEKLTLDVDIPYFPLKKEVEFKFKESIYPSYDRELPYLRLSSIHLSIIHKLMMLHKKKYNWKTPDHPNNLLWMKGDQLVLSFSSNNQPVEIETKITEFASHFGDLPSISFSDKGFYLMRWMTKTAFVEDVVFLPRKDYCVIEGYQQDLIVKVRMSLKK